MTFKLYGTCDGCRKKRWCIRKRQVRLPIGKVATSKDLFCGKCFTRKKRKLLEVS